MSAELKKARQTALDFCAKHAVECVRELLEWQDTAILCDGRMRELAKLCAEFTGNHDGLKVAERMVEREACEQLSRRASGADGFVLAPKEPTGVMKDAGAFSGLPVEYAHPWIAAQVYRAMLAAAPSTTTEAAEQEEKGQQQ